MVCHYHSGNMDCHPTSSDKPAKQARKSKDPLSIAVIVEHILHFTHEKRYLYIGTVSTLFNEVWVSNRKTTTQPIFKGVTVGQVMEGYDSGLGARRNARTHKHIAKGIVKLNRMDLMLKLESLGHSVYYTPRLMVFSAENANVEMTERLLSGVSLFDHGTNIGYLQDAFCGAMRSGSLEMVSWFVSTGCSLSRADLTNLCTHGDVLFVKTVWDTHVDADMFCEDDISLCVDHTLIAGNIEVVKFLQTKLQSPAVEYMEAYSAVLSNRLDVLQYVVSQGVRLDDDDIGYIGHTGNVEMLEYIKNHPQAMQTGTTLTSAKNILRLASNQGHLNVLRWCHLNGYDFTQDRRLCAEATCDGHLEVLKFLRGLGCEYGDTAKWAKRNGHIKLLTWARLNGLVEGQ